MPDAVMPVEKIGSTPPRRRTTSIAAGASPSIQSRAWKVTEKSKCFWTTPVKWIAPTSRCRSCVGFEKFVQGRPVEEMPQITSRICGVCPMAHHMAATKALDAVYHVVPPEAAKKIRELVYCTFMVEDHSLHFYYLGGPDFVLGPDAPAAQRNILGVIEAVGLENAKKVISMRRRLRELITLVAGKAIHPVFGLPGGVAKRFTPEMQSQFQAVAEDAVAFATSTLRLFDDVVLGKPRVP